MISDYNNLEKRMETTILAFKGDLSSLRTGRASVSLLEKVQVSVYGSLLPIHQVATISVPEARVISVSVWDKAVVSFVDRAIREADSSLNPVVEGTVLRITLPDLNEERRKEIIKIAHNYAEHAKIAARHIRRDGMDYLKKQEKSGTMSEDDCKKESNKIQKLTDDTIKKIDDLLAKKEQEIIKI